MKRIDVLKGIEQILVQKAYETGHISHRADGDWQKQADGSWKPYKGQSARSIPQAQKPTENTEYGEITEEDLKDSNVLTKKGYEDFGFSEPRTKKQARKLIENIADRLEQEYPNINDMLKNREHINGDFQREQEETVNDVMEKLGLKNLTDGDYYTRDAVESLYAKIHGHWYDEENSPQSDNADNNHEKYNIDGNVRQKIKDLAYKYNAIYDNGDFDTEQTEDIMRKVGLDPTDDSQLDAFSDVMYDIGHGIEKTEYGEITEEDSNDWEEEDTEGYYGNSGGLRSTIYEGAYDTQISNIGNTEEDDYGNSIPNDEAVENVVRGIMQEWTGDTDDEDAVEAVHDGLKDAVLDRWSSIYVQKSAVRDMRSTPTVKNMGF